jgi:hypothetical protein
VLPPLLNGELEELIKSTLGLYLDNHYENIYEIFDSFIDENSDSLGLFFKRSLISRIEKLKIQFREELVDWNFKLFSYLTSENAKTVLIQTKMGTSPI